MREYSSSNHNLDDKNAKNGKKFIVKRVQTNRRTNDDTAVVIDDDEAEDPEIDEQES